MVDAVGVADERVRSAAQVEQPVPVGIVAGEAGDLEAEHDTPAAECDLGGHLCKAAPVCEARARDTEIFVYDLDLITLPYQLHGALDQSVLPLGRLAVVLELGGGGLAYVDEGAAAQVS